MVQETDAHSLFARISAEQPVRLIDVRTSAEISGGTIHDADHLPLHLLPLRTADIPQDEPVVFFCRSGARSAQACRYLTARGHSNVINLSGGIVAWLRNGLPLTQPAFG